MFEFFSSESFSQFWNYHSDEESIVNNDLLTSEGKSEIQDGCSFMKPKQGLDTHSLPSLFASISTQQSDYLSKLEQALNVTLCCCNQSFIMYRFERRS